MADWSAVENFDSYTAGGLNGDNGGSGWSGAWTSNAAGIVSITQFQSSPNGLLCSDTAASSIDANRSLTTGVTSGICRVYIFAGTVPSGTKGFYPALFRDGTTIVFRISWGTSDSGNSGNTISLMNGAGTTGVVLSTTASNATWYAVDVQFDQTNSQARASFGTSAGVMGPWSSFVSNAFTSVSNYRITTADGNAIDQGYYIDSIGVGTGPPASSRLLPLMGMGV